jgi:hypothetical protein
MPRQNASRMWARFVYPESRGEPVEILERQPRQNSYGCLFNIDAVALTGKVTERGKVIHPSNSHIPITPFHRHWAVGLMIIWLPIKRSRKVKTRYGSSQ